MAKEKNNPEVQEDVIVEEIIEIIDTDESEVITDIELTSDEKVKQTLNKAAKILDEALPEDEKPVRKQGIKKPFQLTKGITEVGSQLDDGNMLITAKMPSAVQKETLAMIEKKISRKEICYGTLSGTRMGNGVLILDLLFENIQVIIPHNDFFAFTEMRNIENDEEIHQLRRYRQKAQHMFGAIIGFVPLKLARDEETNRTYVIASRKTAMERKRNRFYFGKTVGVKKGNTATANILSIAPSFVTVEVLGVETTIGTGGLSAFTFIDNCKDHYKVGTGLAVIVESVSIEEDTKKVELRVSHSTLERLDSDAPVVSESMVGGRYKARIVAISKEHYIFAITAEKLRGVMHKNALKNDMQGVPGDDIVVQIRAVDKKQNYLIADGQIV